VTPSGAAQHRPRSRGARLKYPAPDPRCPFDNGRIVAGVWACRRMLERTELGIPAAPPRTVTATPAATACYRWGRDLEAARRRPGTQLRSQRLRRRWARGPESPGASPLRVACVDGVRARSGVRGRASRQARGACLAMDTESGPGPARHLRASGPFSDRGELDPVQLETSGYCNFKT
jgi:hypothetical protein